MMKSNWISRLDFFKLGFASLTALSFSSVIARATTTVPSEKKPTKPVIHQASSELMAQEMDKYPPGNPHREYMGWHRVEESGADMGQITSSPLIHQHIYPEAPVFTPDSRFFVYARSTSPDQPVSFWLCETETWRLFRLTDEHPVTGAVISPDGEYFYYVWEKTPDKSILIRKHLWSESREEWIIADGINNIYWLGTISPDGRYYWTAFTDVDAMSHIIRFDLLRRTWKIIHSGTDIFNAHPQCDPGKGKDLLIQHNRGGKLNKFKEPNPLIGPEGATLYLIDMHGENYRPLPIGKPFTPKVQGHQCWLGKTRRMIVALNNDFEIGGKKGNLVAIAEGDEKPTVVAGGKHFWHVASSADGKFFISDDRDGNIWIGSVKTGKYRKICNSGTIRGAAQYTHSHPFLSPDCKYAFFNSTATGLPQIYAATVPEEFIESIEI